MNAFHSRFGGPRVHALCLAVALGLGAAASGPDATLSYRVAAEVNGGAWGEWEVVQGEQVAIARFGDVDGPGEVALVAGPAVGDLPAEPMEMGVLSTLFDPESGLGPGYWKASTYGTGTAVVDSLRLELQEGDAHEVIQGHATRHHVLTARLWWRHVPEEGGATPVAETGTADLWFAPDLPFSWLPLGVHPQTPGLAFPLAHGWPEVAWAAIAEHGNRLTALGLLLRARTRDELRPTNDPEALQQFGDMDYERSVTVSDVSTAEMPDPAPFAGLPRVTRGRTALLDIVGFLLQPCGSLASAQAGSFQFIASSPEREYLGGGQGALLLTDPGVEESYVLTMGVVRPPAAECTVIFLPGTSPSQGTFALEPLDSGFARPGADGGAAPWEGAFASGIHVLVDGQIIQRILVLEGGEVRIDRADASGVAGALEGEAWGLELDPAYPRGLFEGFELDLTFEAVPAAPGS